MDTKIIKQDAKQVVDLLFDTKIFKKDLTRDNLNSIEEYIGTLLETRYNSYVKKLELKKTIENQNS